MMRLIQKCVAPLACGVFAVTLAGCGTSASSTYASTSVRSEAPAMPGVAPKSGAGLPKAVPLPSGAAVPQFSGAYASEFETAYRQSTSDLQRRVLADGRLTEAEMSALWDQFRQCSTGYGLSGVVVNTDGSMSAPIPAGWTVDQQWSVINACRASTVGTLDMLYNDVHQNPAHEDTSTLMASCLVRVGLAPAGYTGAQYQADSPNNYPFDSTSAKFTQCIHDPATAGR